MKWDKPWLLAELSKASLILAVASGLPYAFGDVANVLGPEAKKVMVITTLSIAGAAKFVEWAIRIISAFTGAPVQFPPLPAQPSLAGAHTEHSASPLSGPALKNNTPQ